jgi:MarR family transcriptional regulator, organic hydroperoxide resistance regulator
VSGDALLPAERKILEELGHLPLDFRAMWAISNVFRSSTALRRHLEATVLAPDRLSWTAFTALWVLWIWGEMESRAFASAVGISRPTATGVLATLHRRRLVRRRKATKDGRVVLVSLTPSGRRKIEDLFPRFNLEETKLASSLASAEQEDLASMLRSLLRGVAADAAEEDRQVASATDRGSRPRGRRSVRGATGSHRDRR